MSSTALVNQEALGSNENTLINENNNSNLVAATLNANTNSNQANTTLTTNTQTNTPTTGVVAQTHSSVVSSKFNSYIELENQFILRLPAIKTENGTLQPHPATIALREALATQNLPHNNDNEETASDKKDPLKDRLFIDLNVDTRKGRVKFDNEVFEARLVDLPCIIESLKTTDKKTFYKSSDISQMLVCKTKDDPFSCDEDESDETKDKKKSKAALNANDYNTGYINPLAKKYQWPHGLAPPLKNVRRKRFRKAAKKKIIDYAEIEKEVKQLFRADREADQISFEICYEEKTDTEDEEENLLSKINEENNKDDYDDDDLSQDELSKTAYGDKSQMEVEGASESLSTLRAQSAKIKSSKNTLGEESNMSFAGEDEASMMDETSLISNAMLKSNKSNENKMGEEKSDNSKPKSRTTFKNLFDVIGDLSSSSEDENENENVEMNNSTEMKEDLKEEDLSDEESDDEDNTNDGDNQKSKKEVKSSKANVKSELFGEDSLSNTSENQNDDDEPEQTKERNAPVNIDEDSMYNLDAKPASVSKQDEARAEEDLNEDMGDDNSLFTTSKTSISSEIKNAELNGKLNKLKDELQRIQEERKRKEIEINPINNPQLKALLTSRLNNLIEEERRKTEEIDEIKSLFS